MKHLLPVEAQAYLQEHPESLFLDVRMELEYLYVGHPPGIVHVAWYEYPEMQPDVERFVAQVKREAGGDLNKPLVLLCRSGTRTVAAGQALEAAGFAEVVNIVHGFEGDPDQNFQRGRLNGWRHDGLPWEQM
ncbi:rhodanese-like domain-containing protein [Paucibacter sp. O1-1]|uniref:rhodanese-like domain-containing protein n=1 Tax=Paucibacter sp. M5-1 TaxID=3015998 RepID=UPI0010F5D2E0|nr:rhodanese-like domain-containing protein [Paucibacter sp. M5-1]MCU7374233.1 rhodanese-like domain-containing protein [Paucibacter sp. O1-1]MCZ7882557.1 rhodanese-like domain-containing protein [Paucibacter sp. M5-1]MDA3829235.1 rhodanese-like domain-containing protein [Paucibacter sp. O1-1]